MRQRAFQEKKVWYFATGKLMSVFYMQLSKIDKSILVCSKVFNAKFALSIEHLIRVYFNTAYLRKMTNITAQTTSDTEPTASTFMVLTLYLATLIILDDDTSSR